MLVQASLGLITRIHHDEHGCVALHSTMYWGPSTRTAVESTWVYCTWAATCYPKGLLLTLEAESESRFGVSIT